MRRFLNKNTSIILTKSGINFQFSGQTSFVSEYLTQIRELSYEIFIPIYSEKPTPYTILRPQRRIKLSEITNIQEDQLEFYHRNDQAIKSLVSLAQNGHYPLFEGNWMEEIFHQKDKGLTGNEKAKAKTLFKRLCEQKTLERQRTILDSLNHADRILFKRAFMKMVENKILDEVRELQ